MKLEEKKVQSKVFFSLNGVVVARFNFATLSFYDDKGQPTSIIPDCFRKTTVEGGIWCYAVKWWCQNRNIRTSSRLALEMSSIEKAGAVGIKLFPESFSTRELELLHFDKDFVTLVKEVNLKDADDFLLLTHTIFIAIAEKTRRKNYEKRGYSATFIDILFEVSNMFDEAPNEEIHELWHLYQHHSLYLLGEYQRANFIVYWWNLAHTLNEPLFIRSSPIIALQERRERAALKRYDMLSPAIKKYNDLPSLYYENDEYFVRPLISAQEFHDEATQQNNCVERLYMEETAKNKTHIVVLRRKSNPSQSFITVEVDGRDQKVVQYLAKNNANPPAEVEPFMRAYKEHLAPSTDCPTEDKTEFPF